MSINNKNYSTYGPFKLWTIENFPFIEEDFDAITNYQLYSKIVEYMKKLCENQDKLQESQIEVVNYVSNFFDNLDVQEEIDEKLDEMVSDGTFDNIINQEIFGDINDNLAILNSFKSSTTANLNELNTFKRITTEQTIPVINANLNTLNNNSNNLNNEINEINIKIDSLSSGSPLIASSTSEMTETDKIYVNTTDGKWYYYDGEEWQIGGTYQSTGLGNNSVIQNNLVADLKTTINTRNVNPTWTSGSYRNSNGNISTLSDGYISDPIQIYANETIYFKCKGHDRFTIICSVNNDNTRVGNNSSMAVLTLSNPNTDMILYSYTAKQNMLISLCYYDEYEYLYIAKDELKDPIESLKKAINYKKPIFTFTNGKYINQIGNYSNLSTYCYTSPIQLKKDELISFYGVGTPNNVSMISLCDENGNNRVPLIICNTSDKKLYQYQATSDCYVTLCGKIIPFENLSIYKIDNNKLYNTFSTFLSVGCIGDSLASGESAYTENEETQYIDLYDYSWPQFISKLTGNTYYNFSKGGLTTRSWITSDKGGLLAFDGNHTCTGYIIGLGINDVIKLGNSYLGTSADIDISDYTNNVDSFYGNYAKIIQMIKEEQPKAKIFLLTMPRDDNATFTDFNNAIRYMETIFTNVYVIDLYSDYLDEFKSGFIENNKTSGHYNAIAYQYIGQLLLNIFNSYMLKNYVDFKNVQFIGTNYN